MTSLAPGVCEVALRLWRERWQVLESAIAGNPWLLVSGFCWTDVYLAVLSRWALPADWRAQFLPKAERIANAVAERERIDAVWRRHHGATS